MSKELISDADIPDGLEDATAKYDADTAEDSE